MESQTTLEKKIVELKNSNQIPQNSRPKIQRVAEYLRNRTNLEKHYSPKLVSIGPIHHGNINLKLGEKYKLMWSAKYIENSGFILEDLHKKIADNIDELKGHFGDDVLTLTGQSLEGFGSLEEKLSWMLFVDGCSLLYILETVMWFDEPGHVDIKLDQLVLLITDVLLLENQLPYKVLKLLWEDNNEGELIKIMRNFPNCLRLVIPVSEKEKEAPADYIQEEEHSVSITNEWQSETPTHLLDVQRKLMLPTSNSKSGSNEAITSKEAAEDKGPQKLKKLFREIKKWSKEGVMSITYRGIDDLRAVGIRLEASFTSKPADIVFYEGWFTSRLTIPTIFVNNNTIATFLNLIAYEMCPDFKNDYEFCSYVAFMDSLIDHPEDVKALRSKGILCTFWSDEEVANLFNIIGTGLESNIELYFEIKVKIDENYRNKYKSWIALGFRTYFNNPWTIIAFLAAFIALALTFIQTLFTIHPTST
ncbi:DUF247 domain protein [Medicago truncatula]|nr:DUF247 domain protein [Medicago truncatula]